jgi:hypothetical protein
MYTAAIILFGGAAALLLVGTVLVLRTLLLLRRGTVVFGTLVDRDELSAGLPGEGPVVEYRRGSGQHACFPLSRWVSRSHVRVGDRVPVIYHPQRRGSERVMSVDALWSLPIAMAGVAIVLAVVAALLMR